MFYVTSLFLLCLECSEFIPFINKNTLAQVSYPNMGFLFLFIYSPPIQQLFIKHYLLEFATSSPVPEIPSSA